MHSCTLRADKRAVISAGPGGIRLPAVRTHRVPVLFQQSSQSLSRIGRRSRRERHSDFSRDDFTTVDGRSEIVSGRGLKALRLRFAHARCQRGLQRTTMSSSGAKSTKTEQSLFEEDDEFEEFPTEGASQQFLLLAPINAHSSSSYYHARVLFA